MQSPSDLKISDMSKTDSLVRKNIRELTPYSSARDEYTGKRGTYLDANENPYGKLNRYPDPHHRKLRSAISNAVNVPFENIFLGNGSDEAIDLLFRIFCNPGSDKALTFNPTYGMYEVSAAVNDIVMIRIPLDTNFNIDLPELTPYLKDDLLKLIFICSPNNPTSNSFRRDKIINIIENFRGIVIIDEAYIDFSDDPSSVSLINRYDNLVVLRTFSKAFGAAAIRVGMVFANPEIISYLYKVKPPYNISKINQDAALKRIRKPEKYRKQVKKIKAERQKLIEKIGGLEIIDTIYPADANFILVKVKDADAIYKLLIAKNVIVRNRNSVINNCLRITVGTKEENKRLIKELKKIRI
jgi:histidinol-phosphate aminotransferase